MEKANLEGGMCYKTLAQALLVVKTGTIVDYKRLKKKKTVANQKRFELHVTQMQHMVPDLILIWTY